MKTVKLIQLPVKTDDRGNLSFMEAFNHIPFIDRNLLWDRQTIKWGQLCVKANDNARCGMGFWVRPAMLL